ncbi:hypothetical protein RhiirB3_457923 [Rhizophagus irregularis]|nr:hypothetical protein RhiirB3_457923 [Rhizophagus irregularis]
MNGQNTIIDEEFAFDVTYIDEHDHNIFLDTKVIDCCRPPRAPDVFDFYR